MKQQGMYRGSGEAKKLPPTKMEKADTHFRKVAAKEAAAKKKSEKAPS